ncbi:MAG: DUF58 domain-containing protein [Edaphocola sp.]
MKRKKLRKKVLFYLQYFPFTWNAAATAVALWLCFKLLKKAAPAPGEEGVDSFMPFIVLMGKTALWFIVSLIGFGLLGTLACWLYFLYVKRKNITLQIKFDADKKDKGLWLEAFLGKVRRPILGFVKGRLFYDDLKMTDKFLLASNKRSKGNFWREGIHGRNRLYLPDVKEYEITGGFVFFEDMLQLLSLPVRQTLKGHFYQAPDRVVINEKEARPLKTDDTETRIEQLRKVQGEYLNYKDFESGDDVRRIVWKVYAKNRELMVRIPEIFDPYASHVHFFASFYAKITAAKADGGFVSEMLNYYKRRVWSVYESLAGQEFEVKYIPDQELHIGEQINMEAYARRTIANSTWQADLELSQYFQPKYGSVLCISSLNDPDDLSRLLESCGAETVVYYAKLSQTFRNFLPWTWLKRIFLLSPDDRLKRLRSQWPFSFLRRQILQQEKKIENILANSHAVTVE